MPYRRCVGCGSSAPKTEVVRFVFDARSGSVAPDVRGRLKGRGVSVHPSKQCLSQAARSGFSRGFKQAVRVSEPELLATMSTVYRRALFALLSAGQRAQKLVLGYDALDATLRRGQAVYTLLASDASERSKALAHRAHRVGESLLSKSELGGVFGREAVAVLGVLDEPLGDEIERKLLAMNAMDRSES